jgi:catechol 2,3-dioxygenase-like lactoylglutathione lyase family enzyme
MSWHSSCSISTKPDYIDVEVSPGFWVEPLQIGPILAIFGLILFSEGSYGPNKQEQEGTITAMKPRITVLTIGVDDLERSLAFYRDGLGLSTEGIVGTEFEHGAVAFFDLQSGLKLAIWNRNDIAHDAAIAKTAPSPTEFTLGHNVSSKEEVDLVMEQASKAGAKIIKPAQDTFWGGYAGYFQDPDAHLWEVLWNPQLLPE